MKLNLKRCAKRLQRKLAFRQNGFLRAMEQTSLSIDPAYIGHLKGEVDIESVVSVIEKIFVPNHFPTAIFCCSDEVAIDYNLSAGRISGRKNHKWNVISAGWKRAKK